MRQLDGGWFKFPADSWPGVAASLPKPWRRGWMIADLRWYENEVRRGRAPKIPGRRALCRRWGCTDWAARAVMRATLEPSTRPEAADTSEEQWGALCAAWDAFKGRKQGATQGRLKRTRGQGADLWKMRKRIGDLVEICEWINGAPTQKARFLRDEFNTQPLTIYRHIDRYLDAAREWSNSPEESLDPWRLAQRLADRPASEAPAAVAHLDAHAGRSIRSAANGLRGMPQRDRERGPGDVVRSKLAQRLASGVF